MFYFNLVNPKLDLFISKPNVLIQSGESLVVLFGAERGRRADCKKCQHLLAAEKEEKRHIRLIRLYKVSKKKMTIKKKKKEKGRGADCKKCQKEEEK